MKKGFTLIEVIIYIALLTFVMGVGVAASYYLIDSSAKEKAETNTIAEGEFLMRKIDWALTGADSVDLTVPGVLKVYKSGVERKFAFDLASSTVLLSIGGGPQVRLVGDRASTTDIQFIYIPPSGARPAGVTASTTIDARHFEITKYLRK